MGTTYHKYHKDTQYEINQWTELIKENPGITFSDMVLKRLDNGQTRLYTRCYNYFVDYEALRYFNYHHHYPLVAFMLDDRNIFDNLGTIICTFIQFDQFENVKAALELGRGTEFHINCKFNIQQCCPIYPSATPMRECTLLLFAVTYGTAEIVQWLLSNGAETNIAHTGDSQYYDLLSIAENRYDYNQKIIDILEVAICGQPIKSAK